MVGGIAVIEKDSLRRPRREGRLTDLFEGRRQLIIYHFMFAPDVDGWPSAGCPGCSLVVDNIGLSHSTSPMREASKCFSATSPCST